MCVCVCVCISWYHHISFCCGFLAYTGNFKVMDYNFISSEFILLKKTLSEHFCFIFYYIYQNTCKYILEWLPSSRPNPFSFRLFHLIGHIETLIWRIEKKISFGYSTFLKNVYSVM